jgi:hypothetical protein
MKTFTLQLTQAQAELLAEAVEVALDAMEEYKSDEGSITEEEEAELNDLYSIFYEIQYGAKVTQTS